MDQPREEFPPRVSVESVQDWSRIKANVSQAALAALDARLGGSDAQRDAIAANIQHLLDLSFSMSEKNIRANGHKLEELTAAAEDEEAFDEVLDKQIWALQAERLNGERDVAAKRRRRPKEIEPLVAGLLHQYRVELEEEEEDSLPEDVVMDADDGLDDADLTAAAETNAQNSALAEGMRQGIAAQSERIERVQLVERELRARKE